MKYQLQWLYIDVDPEQSMCIPQTFKLYISLQTLTYPEDQSLWNGQQTESTFSSETCQSQWLETASKKPC